MFQTQGSARLGIGVATYNRSARLRRTLAAIRAHTATPYDLVVADDGSADDTREVVQALGVPLVRGENRGVAWNKNRALFYLAMVRGCDPVLLFEDDCEPVTPGWERDWIEATRRWGHIHFNVADIVHGAGTPADPYRARRMGAQCCGYSREALHVVGFFDTRFRGYGHEHVEYSLRMLRAEYGGIYAIEGGAQFCAIEGGLRIHEDPTHGTSEAIQRNGEVAAAIINEPVFRWAWRTDDEMRAFRAEQAAVTGTGVTETGAKPAA